MIDSSVKTEIEDATQTHKFYLQAKLSYLQAKLLYIQAKLLL